MRPSMSVRLPEPSMSVVLSLSTTTRLQRPRSLSPTFSSLRPSSSAIRRPPERIAMSSNIALRRSPKPGALTAQQANVPRILFTTSVASASPSTSSAITRSGLADTVPTCAISSRPLVSLDTFLRASMMAGTALSMPRFRLIGSWPAATSLAPSVKMARASTVAVVVPSPATSEVLEATSLTIWAPMFSNLSASSISLATVTPSLVTVGAPQDFSITTFRPRGPRVTVTASARTLMPRSTFARASSPNRTSFAAIAFLLRLDDAEDVLLTEDQVLLAVELDLAAGVLAEQHTIAFLDVGRQHLPVFAPARAHGHHEALLGLLLGRVADDDPPGAALLPVLDPLDDHPVVQRTNAHRHVANPPITVNVNRPPAGMPAVAAKR